MDFTRAYRDDSCVCHHLIRIRTMYTRYVYFGIEGPEGMPMAAIINDRSESKSP